MPPHMATITYTPAAGLALSWAMPNGLALVTAPVRVTLHGAYTFSVWGTVDSGEGPPAWAEPDYHETFFGTAQESPDSTCQVLPLAPTAGGTGYRVIGRNPRATVMLDLWQEGEELSVSLAIRNSQEAGGQPLPLGLVELRVAGLEFGPDAAYLSAHPYGGRTHGAGALAAIEEPGVACVHGCIGQALPLVYLHDAADARGLQCEFMLDGRPIAWLRPGATGGVDWCLSWSTQRLLAPAEQHAYGGAARFRPYTGRAVAQMRQWRDMAAARYGLRSPHTPDWLRKANIVEFNMNPRNTAKGFTRLDDPRCRALLESWKAMGYTAIFGVSSNHVGQNWLSPVDYEPSEAVGGSAGERQLLEWAHALGFHIFLWVTTVGIDRDAPEVRAHPEWFTHRPDGSLFYAWDSTAPDFVGYAPDADPCATGWRRWLQCEVEKLIARGYDGIFVDGCIPRADNHARWAWPGEGRNGIEDQVRELAGMVRAHGAELITFVEDESLAMQTSCEMTMGRYFAITPYYKKAYWDHGMGGGPEVEMTPPARIPPEKAREYLLARYASLLPEGVSNDIVEGFISDACRPWTVQSLLAGMVPKTHSQYVDFPEQYQRSVEVEPPPAEREPAYRRRGHEEFLTLLRLARDEPLVRDAPLSIEGVVVDGDAAVVGMLRPTPERALLALVQFADRPATVTVRLAAPEDVPASQRAVAGRPEQQAWVMRETVHSMHDSAAEASRILPAGEGTPVTLAPYGFRVFVLTPADHVS